MIFPFNFLGVSDTPNLNFLGCPDTHDTHSDVCRLSTWLCELNRKCNVTAQCATAAARAVCGHDAADWLTELLNHVRAPYVTCWRCAQPDAGKLLIRALLLFFPIDLFVCLFVYLLITRKRLVWLLSSRSLVLTSSDWLDSYNYNSGIIVTYLHAKRELYSPKNGSRNKKNRNTIKKLT